jgi:hypothetical protein
VTVSSLTPVTRWIAASELRSGEQGEASNDRFLTMVFTVENSSSRFGDHSVAGGTAVTLPTFARKSEFDDVEASDASIVRALLVPAKGARLFKLLGLGFLRTFPHAGNINNSKPGDHRELEIRLENILPLGRVLELMLGEICPSGICFANH